MPKKNSTQKRLPVREQVYCLHISVEGTKPLVWRRILVPATFTLEALHSIIQHVMGWQMKHLFDFVIDGDRFGDPDDFDNTPVKSLATSIAAAVRDHGSFIYYYDYGDGWKHIVKVEEISKPRDDTNYPVCIGGENACPPEDCHGAPGYEDLKKVIADPKHPEHAETMRWLGGFFDPTSFDPNRINRDYLWMIEWRLGPNDQGLYLPFNFADDESE